MTELPEPGRIDLRPLDHPEDRGQADRVIRAALARARPAPRVLLWLTGRVGPILGAAAALLLVALGFLRLAPRARLRPEPAALLAEWLAAGHAPTTGEIVAAFQGYVP